MKKLTIIGLGWFGSELAKTLKDKYFIKGTKREPSSRGESLEIYPLNFNPKPEGTSLNVILDCDYLVFNIPPGARNANAELNYRVMMDHLLQALESSSVKRLIFVSSTGVFGGDGEYDEKSEPVPDTKGGRILKEAEDRILSLNRIKACVLRPAGLVGGDRHPAKFLAGRKGVGGRLHPVNLVHRTDLIAITSALLETSSEEKVFHAVAGSHPEKEAYYRTMAEKMGLEKPEFDPSDDSRGKLVRGERTKEWLEVKFRYDDPYFMV